MCNCALYFPSVFLWLRWWSHFHVFGCYTSSGHEMHRDTICHCDDDHCHRALWLLHIKQAIIKALFTLQHCSLRLNRLCTISYFIPLNALMFSLARSKAIKKSNFVVKNPLSDVPILQGSSSFTYHIFLSFYSLSDILVSHLALKALRFHPQPFPSLPPLLFPISTRELMNAWPPIDRDGWWMMARRWVMGCRQRCQ